MFTSTSAAGFAADVELVAAFKTADASTHTKTFSASSFHLLLFLLTS